VRLASVLPDSPAAKAGLATDLEIDEDRGIVPLACFGFAA